MKTLDKPAIARYGSNVSSMERDPAVPFRTRLQCQALPIGKPEGGRSHATRFCRPLRVARSRNSEVGLIQIDPDQPTGLLGPGAIVSSLSFRTP